MKEFFRNKAVSMVLHLIFALGILPLLLLFSKEESLLFINGHHNAYTDKIFYHITRLPELSLIVFTIILSLFYERRIFLAVVVTLSLSGLLILLFKHVLFTGFDRPFQWLNSHHIAFHKLDNVSLHSNGSFPSGHTLAAFAALALTGFISRKGWVQLLLFIFACLAAYSRVYLAQHYLRDVYAGGIIGFTLALLIFGLFQKWFKTPYWQRPVIRFRS